MAEQPPGGIFGLGKADRRLIEKIDNRLEAVAKKLLQANENAAAQAQERHQRLMATLQDLRDALTEQNAAILAEVDQINQALAAAGNVPADVVDSVKAHTATIKGIIADPLPEPDPVPVDPNNPASRRR